MKTHVKSRQNVAVSVGEKSNKEIKRLAVSIAILEVIESDGLLGVTHSKISRKSKVSRAWIYEYIGNEKSALIEFGADVFSGHLARVALVDLPKTKESLQLQMKEGVGFLFDSVEHNPLIIKLYFRFRGTANPVGKVIQKYEKQWLENATKTIAAILGLPTDRASLIAETMMTLRLGFAHRVATASDVKKSRERAEAVFDLIQAMATEALP
jgi:hypothetical protein